MKYFSKVLVVLFWVSNNQSVIAQTFPKDFIGCWQGYLTIYNYESKPSTRIEMGLRVEATDTPGKFLWAIIYQDSTKDYRPYFLHTIDSAKGHYQTDELNGIKLDDYFIGNKLISRFTVQNTELLCLYYIEEGNLIFEVFSNGNLKKVQSGLGTDDIPYVYSFGPIYYQRAVLSNCR